MSIKITAGNAIDSLETLDRIRKVCSIHEYVSESNRKASKAIKGMLDWLEEGILENFQTRLSYVISKFDGYDNELLNSVRATLVLLNTQFVRKLYRQ